MWEALEALFYWLQSRGKVLPTFIALLLVGLVIVLSYLAMTPRTPIEKEIEVPVSIPAHPTSESTKGSQATWLPDCPSQLLTKEVSESTETLAKSSVALTHSSYTYFSDALEDRFQLEGMDPVLAKQLFHQIISDKPTEGDYYDLRTPIRKIFPDLSDQQIEELKELVLQVAEKSFTSYLP